MAPDDDALDRFALRLVRVPGVLGVTLGGSRGRGEGTPTSDTDLGLYYRGDLDVVALGDAARDLGGPTAQVTERGGWGPWVDGGGWLTVDGAAVDLIYRDLDRVEACWERVCVGEVDFHAQAGHPLGVPDLAYPGELATSRVLADPNGVLTALRVEYQNYPEALVDAMLDRLWEADLLLPGVAKIVDRGDTAFLSLCLSRVLLLAAHTICARDGRWVTHEKGLVAIADRMPTAPPGFAAAVDHALGAIASDPADAVERTRTIVARVRG